MNQRKYITTENVITALLRVLIRCNHSEATYAEGIALGAVTMSAFEVRFHYLPSGLINKGMECGWRCFSRILQADAEPFHGTFNDIRTFKPACPRRKPGAAQLVRRKFSLHRPGKLTVRAVAAIDAGDIQIFSFADNTRGERRKDGIISVCRPFHT